MSLALKKTKSAAQTKAGRRVSAPPSITGPSSPTSAERRQLLQAAELSEADGEEVEAEEILVATKPTTSVGNARTMWNGMTDHERFSVFAATAPRKQVLCQACEMRVSKA